MLCGECEVLQAREDDYLCADCRDKIIPIPTRQKIAEILDIAAQVNQTDEYDYKVIVASYQTEGSPWVMLMIGELQPSQFPRQSLVRSELEFAIWEATGELYGCQYGEVDDELGPIPKAEWRSYLKLPLDKSHHPW
jgi:hypothetical protein